MRPTPTLRALSAGLAALLLGGLPAACASTGTAFGSATTPAAAEADGQVDAPCPQNP